jgi:DNA invertase Pin-like site-specific DNA recombinase
LAETFVEVETGKGADALDRRPQLSAALTAARKLKAPIIVAKLDRLSRDVHFISGLMTIGRRSSSPSWARTRIRSCSTSTPRWRRKSAG